MLIKKRIRNEEAGFLCSGNGIAIKYISMTPKLNECFASFFSKGDDMAQEGKEVGWPIGMELWKLELNTTKAKVKL